MREEVIVESNRSTLHDSPSITSLVRTLTDLFGSANDICQELKEKQASRKDAKHRLRRLSRRRKESSSSSSDSSSSRETREKLKKKIAKKKYHAGDDRDSDEESLQSSCGIVRAEYEHGYDKLGEKFARGDLLAQTQLQAQVIALQSTMLKAYQLRDRFPPAEHIFQLRQASQSARVAATKALASLYRRLIPDADESHNTPHIPGAFPNHHYVVRHPEPGFDANPTAGGRSRSRRPKREHEDSPTVSTQLFCPYALDLQRYLYQPLADAYGEEDNGRCPYCRFVLRTRPGKAWEVVLDDSRHGIGRGRKAFLIGNRFVVKCHREGGGLACVLCRRFKNHDTVCPEIADLVDHIWREHAVEEVEDDDDIKAVHAT